MARRSRVFGFQRVSLFLRTLPAKVELIKEDLLEAHANWISRRLQRHILSNDLGWPANKPMTIAQKGHGRVMVETKGYFGSFDVHEKDTTGMTKSARIGPGSGNTHRTGIAYTQVGLWMEFGTKTQAARPLFRPTLKEWKRQFPRVLLPIARRRLY